MNDAQGQTIQQKVRDEFGFDDLSDEKQQALVQKMAESIVKRVLVDAYIKLADDKKAEFDQMMENITAQEPAVVEAFLRENVAEYETIIENAIADLKKHLGEAGE